MVVRAIPRGYEEKEECMIRIAVGSESPIKIEAVRAAVAALELEAVVVPVAVVSGVPPQPSGSLETLSGASHRANQARAKYPNDLCIGIESGLVPQGTWFGDLAYVAVITSRGQRFTRYSKVVPVPMELVQMSLASEQKITAGALEAERSGCDPQDPHRVWSGGKTDRKTLLIETVRETLLAAIQAEGETP